MYFFASTFANLPLITVVSLAFGVVCYWYLSGNVLGIINKDDWVSIKVGEFYSVFGVYGVYESCWGCVVFVC